MARGVDIKTDSPASLNPRSRARHPGFVDLELFRSNREDFQLFLEHVNLLSDYINEEDLEFLNKVYDGDDSLVKFFIQELHTKMAALGDFSLDQRSRLSFQYQVLAIRDYLKYRNELAHALRNIPEAYFEMSEGTPEDKRRAALFREFVGLLLDEDLSPEDLMREASQGGIDLLVFQDFEDFDILLAAPSGISANSFQNPNKDIGKIISVVVGIRKRLDPLSWYFDDIESREHSLPQQKEMQNLRDLALSLHSFQQLSHYLDKSVSGTPLSIAQGTAVGVLAKESLMSCIHFSEGLEDALGRIEKSDILESLNEEERAELEKQLLALREVKKYIDKNLGEEITAAAAEGRETMKRYGLSHQS